MEDHKNVENPQDKEARMNQFFEEMSQKINAEGQQGVGSQEQNTKKNNQNDNQDEDFSSSNTSSEEKQSFFEALQELKKELDPKADELMDKTINKSKELLTKAEQEAKNLFNKFDKYTSDLEAKLKAREEEVERKNKERREKYNPADSLFEGAGGLFDKAKKFMEGDKSNAQAKEGDIKIVQPAPDSKKQKSNDKIYGFDDLDGDGNPIIDDAIIEE